MIRKKADPFEEMDTKPLSKPKVNFYLVFGIMLWDCIVYCGQTFEFAYAHQ